MSSCLKHDWCPTQDLPCPTCMMDEKKPGVVLGLRADVLNFSLAMEHTLRKHDEERGERGWITGDSSIQFFLGRLREEIRELSNAADEIAPELVKRECADVANFAMMIYSILTDRERTS